MSKRGKLPLASPNWWSLGETLKYCRAEHLFREVDLIAAVEQEQVPAKVEYLDLRTKPARRVAKLLTKEFFEREAAIVHFWNTLALKPRTAEWRERKYSLFFWRPDLEKIWPPSSPPAAPHDDPATGVSPRRPPGPRAKKDWPMVVARELVRMARAGENDPTAPQMCEFLERTLGWQPDIRSMQKLLRSLLG